MDRLRNNAKYCSRIVGVRLGYVIKGTEYFVSKTSAVVPRIITLWVTVRN